MKTLFGDPLLRQTARKLTAEEIRLPETQQLIAQLFTTIEREQFGVGLAAPQIGQGVAVAVLAIKPTATRPHLEPYSKVLINPEIIETFGQKEGMWEACFSFGAETDDFPYAQAMRYPRVRVTYFDEQAIEHDEIVDGFVANVVQHEVDHLHGVVFVDRVEDNTTFMMASEFRKRILSHL